MFDLHSHLLPGLDDGPGDFRTSLAMARAFAEQGVVCVACTPHIMPGVYPNSGPQIRRAVALMQQRLNEGGIKLKVVPGADNHIDPDFVAGLKEGRLLTLANSAFVLVEPPHHVVPTRLEDLFFDICLAGYVPVLTHPERLSWIESKYDVIERLTGRGVWMQITSGSLCGRFGRRPRYWAQRMLGEGLVHILATDAHNMTSRPPDLLNGRIEAERLVGAEEAGHLVVTRPRGVLMNISPEHLPNPRGVAKREIERHVGAYQNSGSGPHRSFGQRLRNLVG
jgi:protein-tyrosine phosphatase